MKVFLGGIPDRPESVLAMVHRHLGIDQNATITDYTGRPAHLLPFGEPIRELI